MDRCRFLRAYLSGHERLHQRLGRDFVRRQFRRRCLQFLRKLFFHSPYVYGSDYAWQVYPSGVVGNHDFSDVSNSYGYVNDFALRTRVVHTLLGLFSRPVRSTASATTVRSMIPTVLRTEVLLAMHG